jgi:hypothetical protein
MRPALLPYNRRIVLAAALCAATLGRVALAQGVEIQEVLNVQVAPAVDVVVAQGPSPEQVDQWIFGRLGGSTDARTKLDTSLSVRIDEIARVCGLSEDQKRKLRLAGRGDIKRFFDKVDDLKHRLQASASEANANIWQEIQPLQAEINAGLFGENSIYAKTIKRTLNDDQNARFETIAHSRILTRHRSTVEWFVAHLDKALGLTEEDRRRFIELLVTEAKPPKKFGQADYWYFLLEIADMPESKIKPIFDAQQWRLLSAQFPRARGMEPWLRTNGIIGDNGSRDKAVRNPAVAPEPLARPR